MATTAEASELKKVLKAAMAEALDEKREFFQDLVAEAFEDIALARAIDEGLKTPPATREEVFRILNDGG